MTKHPASRPTVTLIVENRFEKHLEIFREGVGVETRAPVGAVRPREATEWNASPGHVYRIPQPNGRAVRKYTVKPSP